MYRRILVAVENSAADRTILDHVRQLAALTEAEILLVHVADGWAARHFDDLVKELRDGFGVTVIMVSHELPSLLSICDDGVFLDAETQTAIAHGSPQTMREECQHPTVHAFMHREPPPGDPERIGCL